MRVQVEQVLINTATQEKSKPEKSDQQTDYDARRHGQQEREAMVKNT